MGIQNSTHECLTLTLLAACPRLIMANHFAFSPGQVEGPWAAASRLLIFVRSGIGDVIRGKQRRSLRQGDYCLLDWGEPIQYVADRHHPFTLITSHFIPHLAPDVPTPQFKHLKTSDRVYQDEDQSHLVPEIRKIRSYGSFTDLTHVLLVIDRLVQEEQRQTEISDALRSGYLKVILAEMIGMAQRKPLKLIHPRMSDIIRVRDYLERNFKEPLTRQWMAEMAGMSPAHFTRAFTAATGSTPHQYLMQRRLRETQSLLRMTSLTLKEIADKTGFGDAYHLSHAFKIAFGISPQDYRRQTLQS